MISLHGLITAMTEFTKRIIANKSYKTDFIDWFGITIYFIAKGIHVGLLYLITTVIKSSLNIINDYAHIEEQS